MNSRIYKNAEGDFCIDVDLGGAGGISACTIKVRAEQASSQQGIAVQWWLGPGMGLDQVPAPLAGLCIAM
jgi:hypothetical protein